MHSFSATNGACSVHEWQGSFRQEQVTFKMTSVCGHVMSLDFISKFNNWDRVDPVCLISAYVFSHIFLIHEHSPETTVFLSYVTTG